MAAFKQALISVSDKTGIVELARALTGFGIALISTGGTASLLRNAGLAVTEVADYTGFREMLDGRVKTLHPRVHAGILARRDVTDHMQALESAGIPTIDLVVVNLYPFGETVAQAGCTLEQAIENIDIGGPTLVRAAAKNYPHVAVVTDPADYANLLREMNSTNGALGIETRFQLAQKAFSHTAAYDGAISNYLTALDAGGQRSPFPMRLNLQYELVQGLRYGENPHQNAAFYRDPMRVPGSLGECVQQQGKELSYNNIADADAAWECVKTFGETACVIVKHANPCGVALGVDPAEAYCKAFATDPISAFGGIIAFNREVDAAAAEAVSQQFVEVLIAPAITEPARAIFARKSGTRILTIPIAAGSNVHDFKRVGGGLLVQTPDTRGIAADELRIVTQAKPGDRQLADLLFAWRVAKFVKSNAIVFCGNGQTLGVGAGQMSRVDSARIAALKAANAGLTLAGSVVASDAFFPFRDGIEVLAQAGATAVIQPGGSLRDEEVIAAADEHGIAMAFTGVRHFRH
ncbi:MAG TPA: bifunctional phosphoribosylaminoimidazolecarboxamide formyltransferase/IMP cyclohydrolase [Burkholderiales bacterium]|nr:bifunctional phosphoribosylaminoimidazolecarboxamide formyltransferase/IMP cyclohydrolase [Burkholderiales bacterium]